MTLRNIVGWYLVIGCLASLFANHNCWRVPNSHHSKLSNIGNLIRHPSLTSNTLANGLQYLILPSQCSMGTLSAYLEILSGSASEKKTERGLAHFMEHVAFMGASARDELFQIKGARTNAFTDFHHTVYFASCPTNSKENSALDTSLGLLSSVLGASAINSKTFSSEKAAILSEMVHVNNHNHRMNIQRIHDLHSDNILSSRDPIGIASDIHAWSEEDMCRYQKRVYRPVNAVLYVVGDIDAAVTEKSIQSAFGSIACDRSVVGNLTYRSAHLSPFNNISNRRKVDSNHNEKH